MIFRRRLRFVHPAGAAGGLRGSCDGHPVQRHEAAHVVGEVLQADLGARPHDTDRAYDPAADRALLRSEHMLDAGADFALGTVRSRLHRARALLIEKLRPVADEEAVKAKSARCFA